MVIATGCDVQCSRLCWAMQPLALDIANGCQEGVVAIPLLRCCSVLICEMPERRKGFLGNTHYMRKTRGLATMVAGMWYPYRLRWFASSCFYVENYYIISEFMR